MTLLVSFRGNYGPKSSLDQSGELSSSGYKPAFPERNFGVAMKKIGRTES